MSPLHDPANPDHVATYQAGLPWVCLACAAVENARTRLAASFDADDMAGFQWAAELIPRDQT